MTPFSFYKSIYSRNVDTMKKLVFVMLLLFGFVAINAQSYEKKVKAEDFGTWDKEISPANKISISSYVTKQKILSNETKQMVTDLPKYRYELVLQSNSIYNGSLTKTWIYGARVFIDSLEVTRNQSPDGFTAIIGTTPTVVYRYDTSIDTINIKITWKSSVYYRDR
jgi:hypothetical protein